MVKSTWPGVSIRFTVWLLQRKVTAAELIEMPLSRSWGIKSVVARPSSTSPIRWLAPA